MAWLTVVAEDAPAVLARVRSDASARDPRALTDEDRLVAARVSSPPR